MYKDFFKGYLKNEGWFFMKLRGMSSKFNVIHENFLWDWSFIGIYLCSLPEIIWSQLKELLHTVKVIINYWKKSSVFSGYKISFPNMKQIVADCFKWDLMNELHRITWNFFHISWRPSHLVIIILNCINILIF